MSNYWFVGIFVTPEESHKYLSFLVETKILDSSGFSIFKLSDDYEINSKKGTIEVLGCEPYKIFEFDTAGNLLQIREIEQKKLGAIHFFTRISEDTLLLYSKISKPKGYMYSFGKKKIIDEYDNEPGFIATKTPFNSKYSPFIPYKNEINYFKCHSNVIGCFSGPGSSLKEKYRIDFGKKNFDIHDLPKNESRNYYRAYFKNNSDKHIMYYYYNIEYHDKILTSFLYKKNGYNLIINKNNNSHVLFTTFEEKNRLPNNFYIHENIMYGLIQPMHLKHFLTDELLDEKTNNKVNQIKDTDNLILVKYEFKD